MFTQKCYIRKNTKGLREKLNNIGYKICPCSEFEDADWLDTYCQTGTIHGVGYTDETDQFMNINTKEQILNLYLKENKVSINCGENEELFLAIAALRDDCDYMQWFVMDVEIYVNIPKGTWFKATNREGGYHIGTQINPFYCHKATVEELIEHFKNRL